jgi:hypothetical protein
MKIQYCVKVTEIIFVMFVCFEIEYRKKAQIMFYISVQQWCYSDTLSWVPLSQTLRMLEG